jgi:hypothetical protein
MPQTTFTHSFKMENKLLINLMPKLKHFARRESLWLDIDWLILFKVFMHDSKDIYLYFYLFIVLFFYSVLEFMDLNIFNLVIK